jgi:molybdate transport system substrate-binding protein
MTMIALPKGLLIAAVALGLGWPAAVIAEEIRVAVASNFAPVMEKLAPAFEQQSGHKVTVIGGASGQHYAQIMNGAPFDVFLSADDERPALLVNEGEAVGGSVFTYAIGRLVLWSGDPDVVDADGSVLRTGTFHHLALANPQLAPYGKAAREVLMQWGLLEALQGRLVMGENITQTLQFVHSGSAELGFIARSQWLAVGHQGSAWEVPAELHAPIVQQGVLVRDSMAGRALVQFLVGEHARPIIEAAGYETP